MRGEDGEIVQWNGVCLDIEEQVRAQEELRQVQEKLARAAQAASLAELSASIAHEVNKPLAAIMTNAQARSEERRVGREGASTCRSWWSPEHSKKHNTVREQNTKQITKHQR